MTNLLLIEIPETKRKLYLPLTLDACNKDQYTLFCALFYNFQLYNTDYFEFRVNVIYALLGLKKGSRKLNDTETENFKTSLFTLSEYVDEFLSIDEEKSTISLNLAYKKNHIDFIKLNGVVYFGPTDFFTNSTYGEYEDAVNVLMNYESSKDRSLLIRLLAIYYREKISYDNSNRVPYSSDEINERIIAFETVDIGYLYGFYYTFSSFYQYISSSAVVWEGNTIDMSIIFTEQLDDENDGFESSFPSLGLKGISFLLAESGVFGSHSELRKTNLWSVMLLLYYNRKRDLDRAARAKLTENQT